MKRGPVLIVLAGAAIAVATIFATQQVLGLFPSGSEATPDSERAAFLAHLLLPLTVVLAIFVAIAVVGGAIRLLRAVLAPSSEDEQSGPG